MAFDTEQQPPPYVPPAPSPAPPATFTYAPSGGGRRLSGRVIGMVAAVAVVGAAAFAGITMRGGDDPAPAAVQTAPKPKPKAAAKPVGLTKDPQKIKAALKDLATAEESYATDNDGMYTTSMTKLRAEGLPAHEGVRLRVHRADKAGYCISAGGAERVVVYFDSVTGYAGPKSCA
ncbi:MAG TPA: hypothetical protein VNQ77_18570 [Frankiaceae bacterium]|nr:hypothetical protein [Frankiaceae bacterium]